jgi:tetratricopeptide (TPR) repeat protein
MNPDEELATHRPPRWTVVPAAAAMAGLIAVSLWSIRAGAADYRMHQETVGAAHEAIALTPDQSEAYARLAWLASGGDPQTAKAALLHAVAVNPWDTRSRIELGLLAEAEGDLATSARYLLQAAEADHLFLPRWTLANYYFRRGDTAQFWRWAKETADRAYGDTQPLFRLCGRVAEDGKLLDRLQIQSADVRAGYLSYLLGQNRVDLIAPAVRRLLQENRDVDAALLWQACERLLEARRVDEAMEIWNRQADAGRAPSRTSTGEGEQLTVNSEFAAPPTSRGFDWRLPVVEGISFSREDESHGLRVTFSGRQPEDCEALAQLVAVRGQVAYDLEFVYRTPGLANAKGIGWRMTSGDGSVLGEVAVPASDTDATGRLSFRTPEACGLVRLALTYHRAPGTTRLEGFLVLRKVTLEPASQPPIDGSRVK